MGRVKNGVKTEEQRQKEIEKSNLNWTEKKLKKKGWKYNPYWFEKFQHRSRAGGL